MNKVREESSDRGTGPIHGAVRLRRVPSLNNRRDDLPDASLQLLIVGDR